LGRYEVVFGLGEETNAAVAGDPASSASAQEADAMPRLKRELTEINGQMRAMRNLLLMGLARGTGDDAGEIRELSSALLAGDFSADLTAGLMHMPVDGARAWTLHQRIRKNIERLVPLRRTDKPIECLLLAGPSGSGKTTTIAKIAARYGAFTGRSVHIASLDTWQVGGLDRAREYAKILGATFSPVESAGHLEKILADSRNRLVLVDTPGDLPETMGESLNRVTLNAANARLNVFLVLPATMRLDAAHRCFNRWAWMRPDGIIATQVDQATTLGAAFSVASASECPIAFLSAGNRVPEDLEAPRWERLAEWVPAPAGASQPSARRMESAAGGIV
jgi:flagellar biosynthesis protein FlhF